MFKNEEIYKIATFIAHQINPDISEESIEKIREKIFRENSEVELSSTEQTIYEGALAVERGERFKIGQSESASNRFDVWRATNALYGGV